MDIPLRGCPFVQGVGQPCYVLLRLIAAWLIWGLVDALGLALKEHQAARYLVKYRCEFEILDAVSGSLSLCERLKALTCTL
jgi:hypothetical protein